MSLRKPLSVLWNMKKIKALKDWHQSSTKVMHQLSISVTNGIVGHIQDANSPREAWNKLVAFNANNEKACKIQLKNDLNAIKQDDSISNEYTFKIKGVCESLASVGVTIDDDKVESCLCNLRPTYK